VEFTLRQLETFVTIANYGSTSRAAQILHMSQPAVSKALTGLERQFGNQLFERRARRLHLNEIGRALLPKAQNLLAEAREIEHSFARRREGLVGLLRVGASSTIANYLMPEIIGQFITEHPEVRMSMSVGNTSKILAELRDYDIDIALIEGLSHSHDLETIPWREDRLVIVASPDAPLARSKNITLDDLTETSWIIREPGSGTRQNFERAITNQIGNLKIALELGQMEAVKRAVSLGYGISCLSHLAVEREIESGHLVELQTPLGSLTRSFFVVVHKTKHRSDLLRAFLEEISGISSTA